MEQIMDMTKNNVVAKKYSRAEIISMLEQEITEHAMLPGVKLPTSTQIARKCGVSSKTADRAVRKLVKDGLISRVRGSGSYVVQNRKGMEKPYIAFFHWRQPLEMAELNYAAYDSGFELMSRQLDAHGYRFDRFEDNTLDKVHSRIFKVELDKYDVVIAVPGLLEVAADILRNTKAQVILIYDDVVHPGPWHQVVYDYQPGFAAALEYLLKKGCRKFFIAGNDDDTSQTRVAAILAEGARLKIDSEKIHIHYGSCELLPSSILAGSNCADYYIANRLFDHAILVTSDFIAFGMLNTFAKAGYRPGRDFQLISYDNLEARLPRQRLPLGLTWVTHPLEAATEAIIDMLEHLTRVQPSGKYYHTYFIPARELVVRTTA